MNLKGFRELLPKYAEIDRNEVKAVSLSKLSIQEIKKQLEINLDNQEFIKELAVDERSGVRAIYNQLIKRLELKEALKKDYLLKTQFENNYLAQGMKYIAGLDEAGRGPLAGPVVAGAVILDPTKPIYGLDDSKKLSELRREGLFEEIKEKALSWAVGIASVDEIDKINVLNATYLAMHRALSGLGIEPEVLLIDAIRLESSELPQEAIIKGDSLSASIAAASIVAKVTRDKMVSEADEIYPGYGFAKHKGYGSREHIEAIKVKGLSPYHRHSFCKNIT